MAEFVIEERAEPPKAYIDSLEKSKTLEFVTYTTKIVCNENGSEKMTEQEAIENFKEENKILSQYAESKFQKEVFAKKIERNNMAIKALEKQHNNGWIPVDERLPENGVRVLTCDNRKNMHVMRHYNFYKYPFNIGPKHEQYYMPKAWMPLPEPYRECEKE